MMRANQSNIYFYMMVKIKNQIYHMNYLNDYLLHLMINKNNKKNDSDDNYHYFLKL